MRRPIIIVLGILAVLALIYLGTRSFAPVQPSPERDLSASLPDLTPPPLELDILPKRESPLTNNAWETFQKFLKFAKAHDLPGIRSLSYQTSATCNDPTKENECFALMDSVYTIASPFKSSQFKNILNDERQIIMYTDPPEVAILYFTRDTNSFIKVLGMRFCLEDETSTEKCVDASKVKLDANGNGWWDSVESLFYSTKI